MPGTRFATSIIPSGLGCAGVNNTKGDSKMRFFGLFSALVLLSQIPVLAQGTGDCGVFFAPAPCNISTGNQSLEGTWIAQVAMPGGAPALFEVGTYHSNGSYSGANVNPLHTDHKGVWLRVGDRKFVTTYMYFTHDDKGVFNGIVKARATLTLSEDGKSYDSAVERVVMDTSGKELQVITGIKGHSVRMELELQRNP
jgi:hypothetical protein